MRILIDILHPAHVHFFKNFIQLAQNSGHKICVAVRDKEMTLELLDDYGIEYVLLTKQARGWIGLAIELFQHTFKIFKLSREFKPDFMLGIMAPCIAIAGIFSKSKTIAFYDNESAHLTNRVVYRLTNAFITPRGFKENFGPKHFKYAGYHELAYLHPSYFNANPTIKRSLNESCPGKIFFVRFVGWWSSHDQGEKGFSASGKRKLINLLSTYGTVIISSEAPLPDEFIHLQMNLPAKEVHTLLEEADLFIGESSTMASEAVILGTYSLYISRTGRGVNDEQSENFKHAFYFSDHEEDLLFKKLQNLVAQNDLTSVSREEGRRLIFHCIDITRSLLALIDHVAAKSNISDAELLSAISLTFAKISRDYSERTIT